MNISVMFSSASDNWATPQELFNQLNNEFAFTLDPCASADNAKCAQYYTKEQDGLKQNWGGRECFAILRMVEILANGLRNVQPNQRKKIPFA